MELIISNELFIRNPSAPLLQWARENLIFENPEYIKRRRRGLWIGNTDRYITMYRVDEETLILPCGTGKSIKKFVKDSRVRIDLADNGNLVYDGQITLYDYQKLAVDAMKSYGCGIL